MQLEFCGQPLLRGQPHECFFASVTTGKLFEFCSCEYISNMIVSTSRWSHYCIKSFQIRSFSGPYSFQIQENTHEKNSVFGYFSRSALELNYSFPWVEIFTASLCGTHDIDWFHVRYYSKFFFKKALLPHFIYSLNKEGGKLLSTWEFLQRFYDMCFFSHICFGKNLFTSHVRCIWLNYLRHLANYCGGILVPFSNYSK